MPDDDRTPQGEDAPAPTPPRPRMNPAQIETWVDQAIQQAQRQGAFDDLPGAGKPLKNLESSGDPDWWVKGLIEREKLDMTGAMPTAMVLRRERQTFPETLLHLAGEDAVRAHLEDFNERVLADRRKPHLGPGSPVIAGRVDVEEMVAQWREGREACQAQAAANSGGNDTGAVGDADRSSTEHSNSAPADKPVAPRRGWWRRSPSRNRQNTP